jgi:carotenoid cleavage dioxygenase-like enzyme
MSKDTRMDRRTFMGTLSVAGASLAAGGLAASAPTAAAVQFPERRGPMDMSFGAGGSVGGGVYRSENDLYDCEVEGRLPPDLDGTFFRVGPDPQYPKPEKYANDIPFDGEGHLSMFRIKDGHVDFRSRYVRTQRWKAQHAARRSLFGMYRNPFTDDPSVKGLSRGTANTQIFYHHGKILALKEDSPPVAVNPLTLETLDDYYTFGGAMQGQTFTAHPKIDSETGELICFGYEARGLATDDVYVFSVDRGGKLNWSTWIKVPYVGMIHDFGVTQKHIMFYVNPMATNLGLIKNGGPHFAWDSTLPTWLGVMRRGGDGKDIRWYKGPGFMATHTMGNWTDGNKVYWDMDGDVSNQFPFFPQLHEKWDPMKAAGHVLRMSVDLSRKKVHEYDFNWAYPEARGGLSRQDDRYHTVPYRFGFLNGLSFGPGGSSWMMIDHQSGKISTFAPPPDVGLAECCFGPRRTGAAEADGYLVGIASHRKENGRADLLVIDTQNLEAGPIASVKLPYRVPSQVHGFWVPGSDLPAA